jgi:predicted enzyme related to lactoylglutathione lyase
MAAGLSTIGQIATTVKNIDRAVAFYRDTLGLPLLFRAPPKLAFFNCGGIRLMFSEPEPGSPHDHPGSILYFNVDDIEGVHRALVDRGAECVGAPHLIAKMPDHHLWIAEFRDGEGNTLALMEEKRG